MLGIEWDAATCATREAAGLRTLQADVERLDPLDFAPCDLLIASPPCPTFSSAGNGAGHRVIEIIFACAAALGRGEDTRADARQQAYESLLPQALRKESEAAERGKRVADRAKAEARARREADMSLLVVEPLRWALALSPNFIAWEQVPSVLVFWEWTGELLRVLGYSVWTGLLSSERYGVPQTRERAFLMASLDGTVTPPRPTHQRYESGVPAAEQHTLEGTLEPWVSMADALGWNVDVPAPTVTAGGTATGGAEPFGQGGRRRIASAREARDELMVETNSTRSGRHGR